MAGYETMISSEQIAQRVAVIGREIRGRRLLSVFRQEDDEPLARWPIDLTGDTNLELSVPLP